jgi:hypothetical protein
MLLITLFTYGFFAACAGLLLQILLTALFGENFSTVSPGMLFILAAAFTEEVAKFIFLLQAFRRFGESVLQFLSLVAFGVGFALLEVLFAFFMNPRDLPPLPLLTTNALLHIITSLLLGLALRHFTLSRLLLLASLVGVTLLHTLYNLFRLHTF